MRRQLLGLLALLLLTALLTPSVAQAEGRAEIELIVDYLNRHQVTILLPEGIDPEPLVEQIATRVRSPLVAISDWAESEAGHAWLYSAPQLVHGAGVQKAELWDFNGLAETAVTMGLVEGVNLFVVTNQPSGALHYDVYLSDQGYELSPSAADSLELWWGFGLSPGGPAPVLSALFWLKPRADLVTLSALWIPPLAALLFWLLRQSALRRYSWQRFWSWAAVWASVVAAILSQWQAVGNYLLGPAWGWLSDATLLATMLIPFAWATTIVQLPGQRQQARQRQQTWSWRRYLRDRLRETAWLGMLLAIGMTWLQLLQTWQRSSLQLALAAGLLSVALVTWAASGLLPILAWGRRPSTDLGAEAMVRSLSGRLRLPPPQLHFISAERAAGANAFATGTLVTRIYLTQLLWDSLNRQEQQFILAHELAHLRRRDPWRLLAVMLLPIELLALGGGMIWLIDGDWPVTLAAGLLIASAIFTLYVALPYRRRAELQADALALQATADLPSAISALQKAQTINRAHGIQGSQLTHPRLDWRLQSLCRSDRPGQAHSPAKGD